MKHPYDSSCACKRCTREKARRANEQRPVNAAPVMPWSGRKRSRRYASRVEQYGRYIDCGPAAWDDR